MICGHWYLLVKSQILVDNKFIDKIELKTYLKQKPNTRIFGFWRFHLGLYNLSNPKKEDDLFKRIGEAPVIYSPDLTERSKVEFTRYMHNKGYYQARVTDTVVLKKNKKAEVYYKILTSTPHLIKLYQTEIRDKGLGELSKGDSLKTLIKLNGRFDTDVLADEGKRILNNFQIPR